MYLAGRDPAADKVHFEKNKVNDLAGLLQPLVR